MLAFQHDQKLLIERAISGKEVEVAVMGNDSPEASVHVGEIVPSWNSTITTPSTTTTLSTCICRPASPRRRPS